MVWVRPSRCAIRLGRAGGRKPDSYDHGRSCGPSSVTLSCLLIFTSSDEGSVAHVSSSPAGHGSVQRRGIRKSRRLALPATERPWPGLSPLAASTHLPRLRRAQPRATHRQDRWRNPRTNSSASSTMSSNSTPATTNRSPGAATRVEPPGGMSCLILTSDAAASRSASASGHDGKDCSG
jgi:hypothetical protein